MTTLTRLIERGERREDGSVIIDSGYPYDGRCFNCDEPLEFADGASFMRDGHRVHYEEHRCPTCDENYFLEWVEAETVKQLLTAPPEAPANPGEGAALVCADCGKPATGDKVLPDGSALPLCLECTIKRMKAS